MTEPDAQWPPVSPYVAGLACRCPRCGKGKLYAGFLTLRQSCDVCGLDYAFMDSGDGPAVFVILIVGAIVAGSALVVEVKYQPPYWVHAIIWLPMICILSFFLLSFMKSLLLVLQYKHSAGEGRVEP